MSRDRVLDVWKVPWLQTCNGLFSRRKEFVGNKWSGVLNQVMNIRK